MDFKGFRTLAFNAVMALILGANAVKPGLIPLDEDAVNAVLNALIVLGNVALRFVTDSPVGKKY